jgi:hypothetical protein
MMELIAGLKASIQERKDETTPRQAVIPENNALCTPSMVASLLSKGSEAVFEAMAAKGSGPMLAKPNQERFMLSVKYKTKARWGGQKLTFPHPGNCVSSIIAFR